MSVFLIAEAGSSHDLELAKAVRLIDAAAAAGATACKFQFWSSAARLAARRRAPEYEAVYARYQVPERWLDPLAVHCDHRGLEFMVTCYLIEDIATVAPYVKRFKVASFEAGDEVFVRAHAPFGKPVIISTGMMEGNPWAGAEIGVPLMPLACVSAYPCPAEQANLAVLHRWADTGIEGYSDHTACTLTGGLAVAAGASILEVHFRLSDTDPANPDYATALTPQGLRDYIDFVRLAEVMLGDGVKKPQPAEAEMSKYRVQP